MGTHITLEFLAECSTGTHCVCVCAMPFVQMKSLTCDRVSLVCVCCFVGFVSWLVDPPMLQELLLRYMPWRELVDIAMQYLGPHGLLVP